MARLLWFYLLWGVGGAALAFALTFSVLYLDAIAHQTSFSVANGTRYAFVVGGFWLVTWTFVTVVVGAVVAVKLKGGRERLAALDQSCRQAAETLADALQRRQASIASLVQLARQSGAVDASLLERIARAQTQATGATSLATAQRPETELTSALLPLLHQWPALAGGAGATDLLAQLSAAEEEVGEAEQALNKLVGEYNQLVLSGGYFTEPAYREWGVREKASSRVAMDEITKAQLDVALKSAPAGSASRP